MRLIHWSNVVLVIALVATGLLGDEWLTWHMRAGVLLLALVLFRIVWGFIGSRNARFIAFLYGPAAIGAYLRSLFTPPHQAHASHNPLGGWMVVVLLLALLIQAGTGLFTNDDIIYDGPLVKWVTKALSDTLSSFHRQFWWAIIVCAALHVTAVLAYLAFLCEELISAMITGRKRLPEGPWDVRAAATPPLRAVVLLMLAAALAWWLWR